MPPKWHGLVGLCGQANRFIEGFTAAVQLNVEYQSDLLWWFCFPEQWNGIHDGGFELS